MQSNVTRPIRRGLQRRNIAEARGRLAADGTRPGTHPPPVKALLNVRYLCCPLGYTEREIIVLRIIELASEPPNAIDEVFSIDREVTRIHEIEQQQWTPIRLVEECIDHVMLVDRTLVGIDEVQIAIL